MLQVTKDGATVFGKGRPAQSSFESSVSVPASSAGAPMAHSMLLTLVMTQLWVSVLTASSARTLVYPISSICRVWRYSGSTLALSCLIIILSGSASPHVRIAGFGRRASTVNLAGSEGADGVGGIGDVGVEGVLEKRPLNPLLLFLSQDVR